MCSFLQPLLFITGWLWSEGLSPSRNSQQQRSKCITLKRHDKTWVAFTMPPKRTRTSSYFCKIIQTAKIPVCLHTFTFYVMSHEWRHSIKWESGVQKTKAANKWKKQLCQSHRGQHFTRPHVGFTSEKSSHFYMGCPCGGLWERAASCAAAWRAGRRISLGTVQGRPQIAKVVCSPVSVQGVVVLARYSGGDCRQKDQQGCYS